MQRTGLLRGNNARAYVNYFKAIGVPFEMVCSNYTVLIKAGDIEKKFVHSMQSNRAFACFAKLKKDVRKKPIPEINRNDLSYFVHDFRHDAYIGDVINIDLKSAYATVLHRDGYISLDTYNYICSGNKQERLVSVGMLASKKQHFSFDKGILKGDPIEIESEYSNFFYYAVKRTGEIMSDLKVLCRGDYLFTWVDGIYFRPNIEVMEQCEKYIQDIGFSSSTEWLRNFKVKVAPKMVTVDFEKFSKGEWKSKPFNLPPVNSEFKRLIVDAIISRKAGRKDPIMSNYLKKRKQNKNNKNKSK